MGTAAYLLAACAEDVAMQPPLLYGQYEVNGKPQRGPEYYDCVGWFRRQVYVKGIAPQLWPTSWNGPDAWTVPTYLSSWRSQNYPVRSGWALPGDTLIWTDNSGVPQHIGIADGLGNVYSSLDTVKNICLVPYNEVGWPNLLVLPTGLAEDEMLSYVAKVVLQKSDGSPATTLAEANPYIRLINNVGVPVVPASFEFATVGLTMTAPINPSEPAYVVMQGGVPYYLLCRNATAV